MTDIQAIHEDIRAMRTEISGRLDDLRDDIAEVRADQATTAAFQKAHERIPHERPCGDLKALRKGTWVLVVVLLGALAAALVGALR